MSQLDEAVTRHVDLFNAAVRDSDYRALVDTFAPTAVMRFLGVPAGPFVGRDAIARAYEESPPDDTMSIVDVQEAGPHTAQVRFEWTRGGTGSMTMSWHDGKLIDLTVAFDN
jgi:ketosteroid isomerase-like protein